MAGDPIRGALRAEERVQQEIRWLQAHPKYWAHLGPRVQRDLHYLFAQARKRGLPFELALLPVMESALDPDAFSPYGDCGLWHLCVPHRSSMAYTCLTPVTGAET